MTLEEVIKKIAHAEEHRSNALKRCDRISAERWRQEAEALEMERRRLLLIAERENDLEAQIQKLQRHAFAGARWL